MQQRTEDQIISKSPIEVTLGEKKYSIKPLTILKQREWRTLTNRTMGELVANFDHAVDGKTMAQGLTAALLQFPEALAELVFAYAPDLPKDEILETATEEQLASAFSAIMVVAYPFLTQLKMSMEIVRARLSQVKQLA